MSFSVTFLYVLSINDNQCALLFDSFSTNLIYLI